MSPLSRRNPRTRGTDTRSGNAAAARIRAWPPRAMSHIAPEHCHPCPQNVTCLNRALRLRRCATYERRQAPPPRSASAAVADTGAGPVANRSGWRKGEFRLTGELAIHEGLPDARRIGATEDLDVADV